MRITPSEKLACEIFLAFVDKHLNEIPEEDTLLLRGGTDVCEIKLRRPDGKVLHATITVVDAS